MKAASAEPRVRSKHRALNKPDHMRGSPSIRGYRRVYSRQSTAEMLSIESSKLAGNNPLGADNPQERSSPVSCCSFSVFRSESWGRMADDVVRNPQRLYVGSLDFLRRLGTRPKGFVLSEPKASRRNDIVQSPWRHGVYADTRNQLPKVAKFLVG